MRLSYHPARANGDGGDHRLRSSRRANRNIIWIEPLLVKSLRAIILRQDHASADSPIKAVAFMVARGVRPIAASEAIRQKLVQKLGLPPWIHRMLSKKQVDGEVISATFIGLSSLVKLIEFVRVLRQR